jgi:hypothetical protein
VPLKLVFGESGFEDDVPALGVAEGRETVSKAVEVGPSHAIGHEPDTPDLAALRRFHRQLSSLTLWTSRPSRRTTDESHSTSLSSASKCRGQGTIRLEVVV